LAGVPLERWYPELADCLLIAVTEKRSKEEIDGLVAQLCRPPAHASRRAPARTKRL
jgi:glycine dehydrogenase subunit 1